jgi:hypothetical protein
VSTASVPRGQGRRWLARGRPSQVLGLLAAGLTLELVLLLGFVRPLSILRHPKVVETEQPLASVLGTGWGGAIQFAAAVLLAFGALGGALWLARGLSGRAVNWLVLGGTLLYAATLLPLNPVGAHDIYHNAADARTLVLHGDNPTLIPPNAHPDDPFYPNVPAWQDFPSVYGPVWYLVSAAPVPLVGDGLWSNVIGQKALTAAFFFGSTVLAMLIAGRIRPGATAVAGLLVGWNPLLQFETAGNGHNDAVMVFFALASLYAVTRRWWPAVFPLLALSVASKYVLVLLGPVLLVWMLRRRDVPRRQIVYSLGLGALVGALVYVPFFAGMDTVAIVRRQAGYTTSSPGALFDALLWGKLHLSPQQSSTIMKLTVVPLFFAAYGVLLWRIPRDPGVVALMRAGFWAVFLLLAVATWWFWPWYLLFLAPLGALLPGSRAALIAAVFSATAMLMYVPYFWLLYEDGVLLQAATAGTAFLVPVLVALLPRLRHHDPLATPEGALAGD